MELNNKYTLLHEIDVSLGRNKPPAIEYIYVLPYKSFRIFNRNISGNPYGHACIRYTLRENQYVMNIVGIGPKMVHFLHPTDYLFSDDHGEGNEQGGVYQRAFAGFRIEDWPEHKIEDMHDYFVRLDHQNREGTALYATINLIGWLFPNVVERGNCSYWTSKGLVEAGIFERPTIWPKFIFAKMYFAMAKKRKDFKIVYYNTTIQDQYPHLPGWLRPFQRFFGKIFSNLKRFANIVITYSRTDDSVTGIRPKIL
jgi:hypothetical protein